MPIKTLQKKKFLCRFDLSLHNSKKKKKKEINCLCILLHIFIFVLFVLFCCVLFYYNLFFRLNRSHEHVKSFFLTEMNTTGNLDGDKNLIVKGRWRPRQVQSLLVKYINDYITCINCRSPDTTLTKDNATRLFILTCNVCNATRSVQSIKAGFHAKTRDERRAERNAR